MWVTVLTLIFWLFVMVIVRPLIFLWKGKNKRIANIANQYFHTTNRQVLSLSSKTTALEAELMSLRLCVMTLDPSAEAICSYEMGTP